MDSSKSYSKYGGKLPGMPGNNIGEPIDEATIDSMQVYLLYIYKLEEVDLVLVFI